MALLELGYSLVALVVVDNMVVVEKLVFDLEPALVEALEQVVELVLEQELVVELVLEQFLTLVRFPAL